jgi:hypothetical protein
MTAMLGKVGSAAEVAGGTMEKLVTLGKKALRPRGRAVLVSPSHEERPQGASGIVYLLNHFHSTCSSIRTALGNQVYQDTRAPSR